MASGTPIVGKNDLLSQFPNIAADWDYAKNYPLRPEQVVKGSGRKVYWLCSKGHSYQASINHRTNNTGCPFCSGQKVLKGFNDLATVSPTLITEWDYVKNKTILPTEVSAGSGRKVWWLCQNGHSYQAVIFGRVQGKGCPYCSKRYATQGENDLTVTHPQLSKEWDYEKNYPLIPQQFSFGSHRKVWWKCDYGHSYLATICNRSRDRGCPYCSGQQLLVGFNDLETTYPQLSKEWDYEKNYPLNPRQVSKGSNKKVWWLCNKGHSYLATVAHRTNETHCPYCTGKQLLVGFNDLATVYPQLVKEWDYTKNFPLLPQNVLKGTRLKVWWLCNNDHSYQASINNRTSIKTGCPYCSGSKAEKLGYDLLVYWHIPFKPEYKFTDIKVKYYPYDIYCITERILIEFDGIQHFQELSYFDENTTLKERIFRDNIKTEYAFKKGIPILRIPFIYDPDKNKSDIERLLKDFIKTKRIPQEIIDFYARYEFSNYAPLAKKWNEIRG